LQIMGFFFLLQLWICRFFRLSYTFCGFGDGLINQQFTRCFKTLFLKSYGNQVCLPRVAYSHIQGFKNCVDNKFLRVNKSSINKSFSKLVKKCSGISFFKLVHSLKKSMACVNIA
jgi:glutaredoxin 2